MGAAACRRAEAFVQEFKVDLDKALHVDAPFLVMQGVAVLDDECVHHVVMFHSVHGMYHNYVKEGSIYDPLHDENNEDLLRILEYFLKDISREVLIKRLEKADLWEED